MSLLLTTPTNPAAASGGAVWENPVNAAADPGTGAAIPVDKSYSIPLTIGAGAETNTLAAPTFVGQRMNLYANAVAGGTRVVTSAGVLNSAGNTTMTFGQATDFIALEAIAVTPSGSSRLWRILANDGVTLG